MWLVAGLLYLIVQLPWRWQMAIGRLIGRGLLKFGKRERQVSEINIKLCFPELSAAEQNQLVEQTLESIGIGIIETAMAWLGRDSQLRKRTLHIEGEHYVKEALAAGHGVLLCGAHFTTLQMIGRIYTLDNKLTVMYAPQKKRFLTWVTEHFMQKHYYNAVQRDDVRGFVNALRNKEFVWFTPDVDAGRKHCAFVDFFGVPASTILATSRYAKMGKAKVLAACYYRNDDGSYQFCFTPIFENFPSDDPLADAKHVNKVLEDLFCSLLLCFLPGEVPLALVVKLMWWC